MLAEEEQEHTHTHSRVSLSGKIALNSIYDGTLWNYLARKRMNALLEHIRKLNLLPKQSERCNGYATVTQNAMAANLSAHTHNFNCWLLIFSM